MQTRNSSNTSVPFPPPGMVGRHEARRVFGVSLTTWMVWERKGKIHCAKWFAVPGKPGRCKLYPAVELERLREEFKRLEELAKPYPDPHRSGCWRVPVTSRKHRMEAIIDDASLPLVQGKRWNWSPGKGADHGSVVLAGTGSPRPPLHQIIMGVSGPQHRVGHLNGDPLDCRRGNLVVRTPSEQKHATRKPQSRGGRACSSRYKGVQWDDDGRKWTVSIFAGAKRLQLGRFISEIDAALAYDAAARERFGQHARLNFADPAEAEQLRALQPPVEPGTFPPAGMIDVDGACKMFSIPLVTWTGWERHGRMPLPCASFEMPSGGECKLYPVEELNRLQDQIRALANPYPDPDLPHTYRVPLMSYTCYREAIIDAQSLPLVEGRTWHWQDRHDGSGGGYVALTTQDGSYTPLARVVAEVVRAGRDTRVSQRNGDPLDCRRTNMIVRSIQEQMFGCRKMGAVSGRKYTSKFKGVSWDKRSGKWLAVIQKDGRSRRLGSFHNELNAAQAYDEAARELFGEHARPNFSDGVDAWLEREEPSERAAA